MKNTCSRSSGPSYSSAISLLAIWDVDEDSSYDVTGRQGPTDCLIAIRTLRGVGHIHLASNTEFTLSPDTLLIVERNRIRRYYCDGPRWRFWWFEFTATGNLHFPLGKVHKIPPKNSDNWDFRAMFTLLARPKTTHRALASALFSATFHRWAAHWEGSQTRTRHQTAIETVMDGMAARLESGWSLPDMARAAHMSERSFRSAFYAVTGHSPKSYFDRMRLSMAAELLKLGTQNVSEIAY